mmetsp:Transcript_24810/g.62792  ORF Transcript_24810/g.62792 Transcript_24810/m.62792 type:complete len:257 (+) Transcript_24810:135-905(+)
MSKQRLGAGPPQSRSPYVLEQILVGRRRRHARTFACCRCGRHSVHRRLRLQRHLREAVCTGGRVGRRTFGQRRLDGGRVGAGRDVDEVGRVADGLPVEVYMQLVRAGGSHAEGAGVGAVAHLLERQHLALGAPVCAGREEPGLEGVPARRALVAEDVEAAHLNAGHQPHAHDGLRERAAQLDGAVGRVCLGRSDSQTEGTARHLHPLERHLDRHLPHPARPVAHAEAAVAERGDGEVGERHLTLHLAHSWPLRVRV